MADKKEDTSLTELWAGLGKILASTISFVLQILWNGFVVTILWWWFVVTYFDVLPLSLPQAIGLGLVALLFSRSKLYIKDEYQEQKSLRIALAFLEPAFILLIGWVVTWFI